MMDITHRERRRVASQRYRRATAARQGRVLRPYTRHPVGSTVLTRAKHYRAAFKAFVAAKKGSAGCKVCGETDPIMLDFHHRDPEAKLFRIAEAVFFPKDRLIEEMAKCDVVCCNCHRRLHSHQE